jgi:bifunctional DNA-binding transcriptional regulator/antitoxin component of YhaV-PrlF toxin-antitoxin module
MVTHAPARLRPRNQLTLPDPVVEAAGIRVGDRFLVEVDADDTDTIRLHRVRQSYAGALRDVYDDPVGELDAERRSWE